MDKKLNLLSINSYHYQRGGADILYLAHAELMKERGWGVHYFSMRHEMNIPCPDDIYFAECVDLASSMAISNKLLHAGRVVYSLDAQRKLAWMLDNKAISIAHVHNIYHHLSPSVLMELKRRGIPTILTAHDLKLACPAYKMMHGRGVCEDCKGGRVWNVVKNRCIKNSLAASALIMIESALHKMLSLYDRNVDRIIVPSRFYEQKLVEWGWSSEKIVYIPNFVDVPRQLPPWSGGDAFLYFGRLAPEKGLRTLIKAVARAGVKLRIAGTGPDEAALRALVLETGAEVEFLGYLRGPGLEEVIDSARAVVLPSEWYENGPLSVIEAFFRGKPLVGARIGGIPELIVEGETGWTFRSGDPDDLARVLNFVAGLSEAELKFVADATLSFAHARFSKEQYFAAITALYAECLDYGRQI